MNQLFYFSTQFRIWATQHLREYIIKGFTMDDDRLKNAGGGNYFDKLPSRIRECYFIQLDPKVRCPDYVIGHAMILPEKIGHLAKPLF
jgi:Virulence protein RhuM family